MKFYTSYFYKIRFFKPNQIPISTAMWDPKWYHLNKGHNHIYKDTRGVLNGVRYIPLVPGAACQNECRGLESCLTRDPTQCTFLKNYRAQLDTFGFDKMLQDFKDLKFNLETIYNIKDPEFIFMFHEKPDNPCSERVVVQQWFKDNGVEIKEYQEDKIDFSAVKQEKFDF